MKRCIDDSQAGQKCELRLMNIFPDVWNVLHDGSIDALSGTVPGTLQIDVSIEYLRERFADPGTIIRLTLKECSHFAFIGFDTTVAITCLSTLAALEPEILSATMNGDICEIICVEGILRIAANSGSIELDNGRPITLDELVSEAEKYWREWKERSQREYEVRIRRENAKRSADS